MAILESKIQFSAHIQYIWKHWSQKWAYRPTGFCAEQEIFFFLLLLGTGENQTPGCSIPGWKIYSYTAA